MITCEAFVLAFWLLLFAVFDEEDEWTGVGMLYYFFTFFFEKFFWFWFCWETCWFCPKTFLVPLIVFELPLSCFRWTFELFGKVLICVLKFLSIFFTRDSAIWFLLWTKIRTLPASSVWKEIDYNKASLIATLCKNSVSFNELDFFKFFMHSPISWSFSWYRVFFYLNLLSEAENCSLILPRQFSSSVSIMTFSSSK